MMRVPSDLGIGFESLGSGTEQFRHRREVPITFLWTHVTQVEREVGQEGLDVQALLIPTLHTGHGKGMPKGRQTGRTPTWGGHDG